MPPLAPPTKKVLPVGSDGSCARPPTRPEEPPIGAGPTAVQVSRDSALVGSIVKMRKLALAWSAMGSPSPEVGKGFSKIKDQLLRTLVWAVVPVFWITSCQVPPEVSPRKPL